MTTGETWPPAIPNLKFKATTALNRRDLSHPPVATESEATEKFSASVPARWITHAVIRSDRNDVLLPVPLWNRMILMQSR